MKNQKLTDKNFMLYAAQNYNNPHCQDMEEFLDDIRRIKYIKKLITRYQDNGELKERLILNHIIILINLFGPEPAIRMLFLKLRDQMKFITPFLVLLSILPERVYNIDEENIINTDEIGMDQQIINQLRKL